MKKKRVCQFPDCITVLSEKNTGKICFVHQTMMDLNDIIYERKKFYVHHYRQYSQYDKKEINPRLVRALAKKAILDPRDL